MYDHQNLMQWRNGNISDPAYITNFQLQNLHDGSTDVYKVSLSIAFMFEKFNNEILGNRSNTVYLPRKAVGYKDTVFTHVPLAFGQS